jgi:tripartite-type tricarboxylate transporter receptor subunit TctC
MLKCVLGAALIAGTAGLAGAQNYPDKPIRLVVPFDAGGTVDTLGRVVTTQITKQSGVASSSTTGPALTARSVRRQWRVRRPTATPC